MTTENLQLNQTVAWGLHDEDGNTQFESRVFNIVLTALCVCVLTVVSLYTITVCCSRSRKPEAAKDNSRIYYIYSNPLPVGLKEEEEQRRKKAAQEAEEQTPLSFQEYARDPHSSVTLDPPIFYMQL